MNLYRACPVGFVVVVSPSEAGPLTDLLSQLPTLLPDRVADIDRLRPRFPTDRALADELVRRGWLTSLQGRWLVRGRGRRLRVGPYLLLDRLGEGGMGHVFLARHRGLNRTAALKIVRPDRRDDTKILTRFVREVRALGRLNHANVVHAYDAGHAGRAYFLAMEFVPGPDLSRLLAANGRLDPGTACEYARQAAVGLHHMHAHGFVHRDIKPANLALTAGGRGVKVLDVGLVKERGNDTDDGLTHDGHLVGSPDYAAPEQVADSRRADHRADQYALGCTLFHLLTGEVPFPGGNPLQKAMRRLTEDPQPIDALRPDLPAGLNAVVGRLLARKRTDRFRNSAAAAAALAPFATPVTGVPTIPLRSTANETALSLPTCLDWRPLRP